MIRESDMYFGIWIGFVLGFIFAVAGGTFYYHYAVKQMRNKNH
jgi:hypothetical protein